MENNRPTVQDVPDHVLDKMAMFLVRKLDEFYANPANEEGFKAWKAQREAAKS